MDDSEIPPRSPRGSWAASRSSRGEIRVSHGGLSGSQGTHRFSLGGLLQTREGLCEELLLKERDNRNVIKPHVSNIDASVAFHEKAFGDAATKRRPGYAKFDLTSPSLDLTMQEAPRTALTASHAGVRLAASEYVAAAWTRFEQAGLVTKTEEKTECCYAVQDKVWVEDPDGNAWEVFVVKDEAAVMERQTGTAARGVPKIKNETATPDQASTKTKASCDCYA